MHDDYDLRQEQLNKMSLLSSRKFLETLLEMFNEHVVSMVHLNMTMIHEEEFEDTKGVIRIRISK